MSTILQPALSGLPIIFLNGTVLAFNSSIGYGSQQESTLNIDLIEDCESLSKSGCITEQIISTSDLIGSPQYFTAGNFTFGGIVSSWSKNQSTSGKIFNIKMVDPRQLLENVTLLIDSVISPMEPELEGRGFSYWLSGILIGINFYNLYEYWEGGLCLSTEGDTFTTSRCCSFGRSESNEQGMPYIRIIRGLMGLSGGSHMIIYSKPEANVSYPLYVDLLTLPQNLPIYYRIPGPSITLLQLIQDVCDIAGYDFYVYMEKQPDPDPEKPARNVIKIGLVDLKRPPSSFSTIVDQFNGTASDISFGEELRNDITRSMIIGENIHKLVYVDKFLPYFGQDIDAVTKKLRPVVPFQF
ncbi:MAG: hypothetical protein ACKO7N_10240, partial [Candidatus Nitrosotenuis sp.]